MKRFTAFLMASLLTFTVTTQPARAFFPVAVVGAAQVTSAGGGTYAIGALAGLVGVVGMYFTITDAADNAVRIPLGDDPENEPPPPAAASSTTPVPTTIYTCRGDGYQGTIYTDLFTGASIGDACGQVCNTIGAIYTTGAIWCNTDTQSIHLQTGTQSGTATCPPGYTLNGGFCTLYNARQASDDKTCDLLISMGQFATADDMNCGSTVDGTKVHPILRNGNAIAYGVNSQGQPLMWEVRNPTPTWPYYTIRQYEQTQTATQTQVTTTEVQVDAQTSTVTSVTTSTSPGSISPPTAAEVPTQTDPQTQTTVENTPTVKNDANKDIIVCGLPTTPPCAIDDSGFSDAPVPPSTSIYQPDLNAQKDIVQGIADPSIGFNWLPSLLPGDAVACVPLEFRGAVSVGEVNLDSTTELDLCPYLDIARNILGWLFSVAAVIYIWRRFAAARGGV